MKLSAIKKLIKEEFLREIKVDKRRITINPSIINDKDPTVQGELEVLKGIYDVIVAKINDKDPIVQGELKALKGIFDIADMIAAKAKQQGLDYSFQASIEYEKDVSWMQGYTDGSHGRIVMIFSKCSPNENFVNFTTNERKHCCLLQRL